MGKMDFIRSICYLLFDQMSGQFLFFILCVAISVLAAPLYRKAFGSLRVGAFFLLVTYLVGSTAAYLRGMVLFLRMVRGERGITPSFLLADVVGGGLFVLLLVPFVASLYHKWMQGRLSNEEKEPGMEGLRAWLRPGSIVLCLALSLTAWLGFPHLNFFLGLCITFGAMSAYTLKKEWPKFIGLCVKLLATSVHTLKREWSKFCDSRSQATETRQDASENLGGFSAEHRKVLDMVEQKNITAEEGAELLGALAQTAAYASSVRRPPIPAARRLVLAGAALILLGFLLPWFRIDVLKELDQLSKNMNARMSEMMPPGMNLESFGQKRLSALPYSARIVEIAGGDVRGGLGWMVLFLAIGIAASPYLIENIDKRALFTYSVVAAGLGGIILLYLLTRNFRYTSEGLVLVVAGYALETVGLLREYRKP